MTMLNLAGVIQTIATLVSARVTMKLSERIGRITSGAKSDNNPSENADSWLVRAAAIKKSDTKLERARDLFEHRFNRAESQLTSSQDRVDAAETHRNEKFDQWDISKSARQAGQAAGLTGKDLDKLFDAETRYRSQLEKADYVLARVTSKHQRLEKCLSDEISTAEKRLRLVEEAHKSLSANPPAVNRATRTPLQNAIRYASVKFRRAIGSGARTALSSKAARKRAAAAQSRLKKARTAHWAAQQNHQNNPTSQTKSTVLSTGKDVAAATVAARLAGIVEAVATAAEGLSAALGPVGIAIGVVAATAGAAVAFINRELALGNQRTAELKGNRSQFSNSINAATQRYDMQSINLEQRSSQATSNSASGVVNSTMALRESNQGRSEAWEDIGNRLLATSLDVATAVSDIVAAVDIFTPAVQMGVELLRSTLSAFGIPLRAIEKNTRPDAQGLPPFAMFQAAMDANGNKPKPQNSPLPPKK
jgi:hypothetical protein